MAMIQLPKDFKDFLRLLNSNQVEYLLVGGYAVSYYGHPRATGDMDIWVAVDAQNAERIVRVLCEFGFSQEHLSAELLLRQNQIVRMGMPPIRIEMMTTISGVKFEDCYRCRTIDRIDGVEVSIIHLNDLKKNKKAAGRHKDLDDLEQLL